MSDAVSVDKPGAFPGRTAIFPDDVGRVAYGLFGVQAPDAEAGAAHAAALAGLFAGAHAPGGLECFRYVDPQGLHCDVFVACWLDARDHEAWFARPDVAGWWRDLPCDAGSETGFWREVMTPHKDYYQYGAGVDDSAGLAALGEIVPSSKFGYWGGYRDRIPASAHDKFLSPLDSVPAPTRHDSRGRRLTVTIPENICFIREGQSWDKSGPEERRIWAERMEPVVNEWVAYLRDQPVETGCLGLRFCRQQDIATGADLEKQSQFAFLLSLRHIERAARTVHAHLAVRDTLMGMYAAPEFTPRMHIWVETLILKDGDLQAEYVNCHPATGLLPYFDVRATD